MITIQCCVCHANLGSKEGGEGTSHTYCDQCAMLAEAEIRLGNVATGKSRHPEGDLIIVVGQLLDAVKRQQGELAALRVWSDGAR